MGNASPEGPAALHGDAAPAPSVLPLSRNPSSSPSLSPALHSPVDSQSPSSPPSASMSNDSFKTSQRNASIPPVLSNESLEGLSRKTSHKSVDSMKRSKSSDSLADRGRQLLSTFERARTDHAEKYGGSDEAATVLFVSEVLRREAPDWYEKYRIESTISCGTTSVVVLARVVPLDQKVAIKFAKFTADARNKPLLEQQKAQFEVEAKLQRRCACAQVVELLDFRAVEAFAIFILEYLPTTLLESTIEGNVRGEHPELQAARHVASIASALQCCHALDVVHLDVKLDNILCTASGEAKLCDFGLADIAPLRRAAATPLYSPPEIIVHGFCDTKADMWSLGVVLFILLCGYPPFQPDDKHDLKDNIVHARYAFREDEGWAGVSSIARDLIARLLVIDPARRYSAAQVLEHPWIVAAAAAAPSPVVLTRPPLLQRHESIINLEAMRKHQELERQRKTKRTMADFLNFAAEIRKGWKEGGWQGVTDVTKRDPDISSLLTLADEVRNRWKEEGLSSATKAGIQGATRLVQKRTGEAGAEPPLLPKAEEKGSSPPPPPLEAVPAKSREAGDDKQFLRTMYGQTSPLQAPVWVPDCEAQVCRLCETPFTFFYRRHHCRACGQVVCDECSKRRRIVPRVNEIDMVRVCDLCAVSSRREV